MTVPILSVCVDCGYPQPGRHCSSCGRNCAACGTPRVDGHCPACREAVRQARERLAAAEADPLGENTTPHLDVDAITDKWLRQCGACDAGMSMSCTCPSGDPRNVISNLVAEVGRLRRVNEEWRQVFSLLVDGLAERNVPTKLGQRYTSAALGEIDRLRTDLERWKAEADGLRAGGADLLDAIENFKRAGWLRYGEGISGFLDAAAALEATILRRSL